MATLYETMIKIGVDTTELDAGMDRARDSVDGFGETAKGVFAGNLIYDGVKRIGSAVVGLAQDSINTGMSFDSAMSRVQATMLKSSEEMEQEVGNAFLTTSDGVKEFHGNLREFAQFLGENTSFSATQAAEALNYMALAGYETQESMTMLPNVLNLAAAGGFDLARASDMITDAQTALGLSFDETTLMVDQMAKTASRTNTSVEQLGDAMLTIGGTARYMSGGPAELSQVLGILADNGIKGSEAGTHLRNMLLKLSSPTKDAQDLLNNFAQTLGHDLVFDEKTGEMRAFEDIFQDLNIVMADFTDQEKVQAFSSLFNARDVASANALFGTTAERWEEIAAEIDNAEGAAAGMANIQLDNLTGAMTLLRSATEGAKIAISDRLTPSLTQFVGLGTQLVQRFTTTFKEDGVQGVIDAGIEMMNEFANSMSEKLPDLIPVAMNAIMEFSGGLRENVGNIVDAGINLIMTLADSLIQNLPVFIETVPTIVSNIAGIINDNAPKLLEAGLTLIVHLGQGIIDSVPTLIAEFPKIIKAIVDVWLAVNWMKLGSDLINFIVNGIKSLVSAIPNIVRSIGNTALNLFRSINWAGLGRTVIQFIVNGIRALASSAPSLLRQIATNGLNLFRSINWAGLGRTVIQFIVRGIRALIAQIPNVLRQIGTRAMNIFKNINWGSVGRAVVTGIANGISNGASSIVNAAKNAASRAFNAAKSWLGIASPSKLFRDKIGKMVSLGFAEGIEDNADEVEDAMTGLASMTTDPFGDSYSTEKYGSTRTFGQGDNITINVYPRESQDEKQIAEEVQNVLAMWQKQREAVFA